MVERVTLSAQMLVAALGDSWPPAEIGVAAELLAGGAGKFPRGVRALPADLVRAVQRERVLAAMLRATRELGYRQVRVQDVLERAGVSRPTFYQHFDNKEGCFLAAFDAAAGRLGDCIDASAGGGAGDWQERMRATLEGLLGFIADEPDAAIALIVDARAACPDALIRRDELLDRFTECLDMCVRQRAQADSPPSPIAAAGIVGGIDALLYSRLSQEGAASLDSLLPSLMYFAVLPYDGHEAASEALAVSTS